MPAEIFTHVHRVTYADCTVGNHVYYGRYLDLLETVRGEFFRHLGTSFLEYQEEGIFFPVSEALGLCSPRFNTSLSTGIFVRMSEPQA